MERSGFCAFFFLLVGAEKESRYIAPRFYGLFPIYMFIGYSSTCESKEGGVALDEALSIIQRCSVESEVLRVLLLDFSFFSLGVEVKHRANTNSFPVFQKDKSAWTSFLHQTAGSDFFFFSCRVKKFCCFTRTEVRFLNVV